jgi:hypothetical protein
METKELVRLMVNAEEDGDARFSKIVSVLANGAFNLKGQELEQVLGVVFYDYLQNVLGVDNPLVEVPQKKKGADLIFTYEEERNVDLKFYGGANRAQLSTLKDILPDIRGRFGNLEPQDLNQNQKEWLIGKLQGVEIDYTLGIVCGKPDGNRIVDIFVYDFVELDISGLLDYDENLQNRWELRRVGGDQRAEIHIHFNNLTLEIAGGWNAYNRGIWINNIRNPGDLDPLYELGIIENIFDGRIEVPEFEKQELIRYKGRNMMSYIDDLFGEDA